MAPDPDDAKRVLVADVKWRQLSVSERKTVLDQLARKWARSTLAARHPKVRFDVLDAGVLEV